MNGGRYPHIIRAVLAQPWAIDPDSMAWAAIMDVLALRASGQALSDEEISARIEAAARGPRSGGARHGTVAVIPIYGVLTPRANMMSAMSGGTSAEEVARSISAALADPEVDGIVLDIDSPGGNVAGITELASVIRAGRTQKPIAAVANHLAASAAFWAGSAASEFVATSSATVGSIGVIAAHDDLTEQLAAEGIKRTIISAGKFKAEGALGQPLSTEAIAAVQADVESFYSIMVSDIARGRGVSVDVVRSGFGQGRTVLAKAALDLGMIDRIGSLEDTIRRVGRGDVPVRGAAGAAALRSGVTIHEAVGGPDLDGPDPDVADPGPDAVGAPDPEANAAPARVIPGRGPQVRSRLAALSGGHSISDIRKG